MWVKKKNKRYKVVDGEVAKYDNSFNNILWRAWPSYKEDLNDSNLDVKDTDGSEIKMDYMIYRANQSETEVFLVMVFD